MSKKGATVKDVPAAAFVKALAAHFKQAGQLEVPENAEFIKTAHFKELAPYDADWYYVRAASIARKIYLFGGMGVGGLAKVYGGHARRGTRKGHYTRASRQVLRHILRQLGDLKLVHKKKGKKGRFISSKGQKDLDTIAMQICASLPRPEFYDVKRVEKETLQEAAPEEEEEVGAEADE